MTDNTTITPGTGVTVAADDVGGVLHQRVKMSLGTDGAATDALGGAGAVAAGVQRVTLASDDPAVSAIGTTNTEVGGLTETAPATDTASSGLNGRLQRVAQRITSLIALLPTSLGTKTAANSLATTLASDDAALVSLGVMDDWDESDRAKVNPIVGQAGVAAGAGAVSALTQRVTLASDDLAVASLSVLDDWDESDRAKVNIIVGQAGVAAGAGAVGATVPRVTLASDDPAVAVLGATSGAKVITDANGTIQQYLRGLISQWIAGTLVVGAGTNLIGKIKTKFIIASGTAITRPANTTPYTAGDHIANNATAGSVTVTAVTVSDVNDEPVAIERMRLTTADTGIRGKAVRVWVFNSDPTANSGVSGGDNAAFSQKQAGFVGTMSGTFSATSLAFSDGGVAVLVPDQGSRIITSPVSGARTLYWLLQTLEDFTPSANSTTFTPTFEAFQGGA